MNISYTQWADLVEMIGEGGGAEVWRPEFYEAPSDKPVASVSVPGTLISTSHTVTLTETSRIRVMAKCGIVGPDDLYRWGSLSIYEGGGTLRDRNYATADETLSPLRSGCSCLYEGQYAAGSYAFALYSHSNTAGAVTASYIKWSIDVLGGGGAQGPPGADSTVPGPTGPTGPAGANGADSTVPGPTGPTGSTGATGGTGSTGAAGADSTVAGPNGTNGTDGAGIADGWIASGQTWTYEGVAAGNYAFSEPIDATAKYSPGMRIRCTQGGSTKYGIVVAVGAYSGGKTIITVYCGTDYALGATITVPFYSTVKTPFGFPMNPAKWTINGGDSSAYTQATPTQNAWYNALSVAFPIGVWKGYYKCTLTATKAAATTIAAETTLSALANTESNAAFSIKEILVGASATLRFERTVYVPFDLTRTTVANYYLNYRTDQATMGATGIRGDEKPTTISAVSAYL